MKDPVRTFIRYAAAFVMLGYGFAKINGSQFTVLDSQLDMPMGRASGFWLTWYYFGYSHFYGTFLALVEIVGALLLTLRRTTLLGACTLAGVLGNVILIDLCYGVDPEATVAAILLFAGMLVLIAPHLREFVSLFWRKSEPASAAVHSVAWVTRVAMTAFMMLFTYWVANYNNRAPTPIDGTWDVVEVTPPELQSRTPRTFFFEHNRAHMAVFKSAEGAYATHHFELDPSSGRLGMWQTWIAKDQQIFDGAFQLTRGELKVSGTLDGAGPVALRLQKRNVR